MTNFKSIIKLKYQKIIWVLKFDIDLTFGF